MIQYVQISFPSSTADLGANTFFIYFVRYMSGNARTRTHLNHYRNET